MIDIQPIENESEHPYGKPTESDADAWQRIQKQLHERGAIFMAWEAVNLGGPWFYPLLLAATAQGCTLQQTYELLRLEPGDIAEIVTWAEHGCYESGNIRCTCEESHNA